MLFHHLSSDRSGEKQHHVQNTACWIIWWTPSFGQWTTNDFCKTGGMDASLMQWGGGVHKTHYYTLWSRRERDEQPKSTTSVGTALLSVINVYLTLNDKDLEENCANMKDSMGSTSYIDEATVWTCASWVLRYHSNVLAKSWKIFPSRTNLWE